MAGRRGLAVTLAIILVGGCSAAGPGQTPPATATGSPAAADASPASSPSPAPLSPAPPSVHGVGELTATPPTAATSDAFLGLHPNRKVADFPLCVQAQAGLPAAVAQDERWSECLIAVASQWYSYLDAVGHQRPPDTLDRLYAAAQTAYAYAAIALGPVGKAYVDAALDAAYGPGASPAPSPDPASLLPVAKLVAAPHHSLTAAQLAVAAKDAIGDNIRPALLPTGKDAVLEQLGGCVTEAGSSSATASPEQVDAFRSRLDACTSLANKGWRLYLASGDEGYWLLARSAFEYGYGLVPLPPNGPGPTGAELSQNGYIESAVSAFTDQRWPPCGC